MEKIILWAAAFLSGAYGGLTAYAGRGQLKVKRIQDWAAWGMIASGLVLLTAAILLIIGSGLALAVLIVGLAGIHALALNNGIKMFGRINPAHHLARLLLSVLLIVLTWMVVK